MPDLVIRPRSAMFNFFALILSFAALAYAQDACESYASSGELACLTGEGYGCNC